MFEAFDENGDGTADVDELRNALTGMGDRMSPEDVDRALRGFTRKRGLNKSAAERGAPTTGEVFRYREFVDLLAGKSADEEDDGGK